MATVSFSKVEGLGNDFVLLDRLDVSSDEFDRAIEWSKAVAPRLCHRRTGIGADGILVVGPPRARDSIGTMVVVNADGSQPEMCGNGLRCVAAFLAARFALDKMRIDTDAGPRECTVVSRLANSTEVRVDMGPATILGHSRPQSGGGREFVSVSVGNPHAVTFVDAHEDPEALAREYGPAVELDAEYQPAKTNVEFVRAEPDGSLTLWVWERGVGLTQACGTGACATAAAAVHQGRIRPDQPTLVRLPGGVLTIEVPSAGTGIGMIGPSRHVFTGVAPVD